MPRPDRRVTPLQVVLAAFTVITLIFLLTPMLVIAPLSFNAEPYFSYPIRAYSTRWYEEFAASATWRAALWNSLLVAVPTTAVATVLGTAAALGLSLYRLPFQSALLAFFIAPMMVPHIVIGLGLYFFFVRIGLAQTYTGLIAAHVALATPFVVLTMLATFANFNMNLYRAAQSLGAPPPLAFRRVMLPLIAPGVVAGAAFAFIVSFDEVIVTLFLAGPQQRTLPRQIWSGMRESISPLIMVVATILTGVSLALMIAVELLRRRTSGR